ncbi:MAG: aminoacyl-tRNA hydrolase [Lachnospiraceae bacterium]|nr:aminoacyl-tRNA hydrolase [Lachnospiraceae bacterium]
MFIIAGLGNPGMRYRKTRHNAGFEVIDLLAKRHQISMRKKDRQALFGLGQIGGEKVLLLKPMTYMNNSGESIAAWVRYYQCDPQSELLVLVDDVSLSPGVLRIRKKGSAGGHNGLKSIIACLGTEQFPRLRIGVGQAEPGDDMIGHVLGRMRKEDRIALDEAENLAAEAAALVANGDIDKAMNLYNKKEKKSQEG